MRALAANRCAVSPAFWPRALATTVSAAAVSAQARLESRRWNDRIAAAEVREPVFILGHYRSGTTHLHNLLAQDARLAYPNNYQASFPHTFLSTEDAGTRLGAALTMRRRPHDNVALDLRVPTEDELALCADTLLSPHMAWHFPRRAEHYRSRYLTFAEASTEERARWVRSLRTFAAKLTVRHGRRLVLKSPLHTARIPLLLEAFPDARFVHLHRDPYRVYQSTLNMERKVEPLFRYQRSRPAGLEGRVLGRYADTMRAYLADRDRVPAGRLVETSYAELSGEPLACLETIYAGLELGDLTEARPRIERYLRSLRDYERNVYPQLPEADRGRVREAWGFAFEAFGYVRGRR